MGILLVLPTSHCQVGGLWLQVSNTCSVSLQDVYENVQTIQQEEEQVGGRGEEWEGQEQLGRVVEEKVIATREVVSSVIPSLSL